MQKMIVAAIVAGTLLTASLANAQTKTAPKQVQNTTKAGGRAATAPQDKKVPTRTDVEQKKKTEANTTTPAPVKEKTIDPKPVQKETKK